MTNPLRQTLADLLAAEDYTLEFAVDGPSGIPNRPRRIRPISSCSTSCCPKWTALRSARCATDRALAEIPILMITAYSERSMRLRHRRRRRRFHSQALRRHGIDRPLAHAGQLDRYRRLNAERERFRWVMDRSSVGYVLLDTTGAVEHVSTPALLFWAQWRCSAAPTTIRSLLTAAFRLEPAELWTQWPERPLTGEAVSRPPGNADGAGLLAKRQRTAHDARRGDADSAQSWST